MEKDRGSAMLTAVIAVGVLALIAVVFFSLSLSRARIELAEERGLRAYYLAESGIQYGLAQVLAVSDVNSLAGHTATQDDLAENVRDVLDGTFEVSMEIDDGLLIIHSEGTLPAAGSSKAVIRIREMRLSLTDPISLDAVTYDNIRENIVYDREEW